jgi:hypothetical protein
MSALIKLQKPLCDSPDQGAFVVGYESTDEGVSKKKDADVGATIGAILGLARKTLPIHSGQLSETAATGTCVS